MPTLKPKPKKPGRPKLPKGNAKAGFLRVRMTADELKANRTSSKEPMARLVVGVCSRQVDCHSRSLSLWISN